MRVNIYTEELITGDDQQPFCEIVTAEYENSRTGQMMTNYGLRVYMRSPASLHYIPGRDDDRSAVTFWVGAKEKNLRAFVALLSQCVEQHNGDLWRDATKQRQIDAEAELLRDRDVKWTRRSSVASPELSDKTKDALREIDDNIRGAYRNAGKTFIGQEPILQNAVKGEWPAEMTLEAVKRYKVEIEQEMRRHGLWRDDVEPKWTFNEHGGLTCTFPTHLDVPAPDPVENLRPGPDDETPHGYSS